MLSDKIKNADRVLKANDLIVKAIEQETNREIMALMLDVSQAISDVHKACISDLMHARRSEVQS